MLKQILKEINDFKLFLLPVLLFTCFGLYSVLKGHYEGIIFLAFGVFLISIVIFSITRHIIRKNYTNIKRESYDGFANYHGTKFYDNTNEPQIPSIKINYTKTDLYNIIGIGITISLFIIGLIVFTIMYPDYIVSNVIILFILLAGFLLLFAVPLYQYKNDIPRKGSNVIVEDEESIKEKKKIIENDDFDLYWKRDDDL